MSLSKFASQTDAAPQTGGIRFAPSPTGQFHIGNLRTAWISYQWSRALERPWVVRFEDIDKLRVVAGALDQQLADLHLLGLSPDLTLVQSRFRGRHLELFRLARRLGAVYLCNCSRKEVQTSLAGLASASHEGVAPVYSGHCRLNAVDPKSVALDAPTSAAGIAWRFQMPRQDGRNDFIIARTSGTESDDGFIPAYHWACAIDDFDGAYDLIVRSLDLAPALTLQRAIQSWIATAEKKDLPLIRAFHTSLVTQDDGHRLEKRTTGVTLHELFSAEWSVDRLREAFAKSFDRSLLVDESFDTEGLAREPREQISLRELLSSV